MFSAGTHVKEENVHCYVETDSLEKTPTQQKAVRQGKDDRIFSNELES